MYNAHKYRLLSDEKFLFQPNFGTILLATIQTKHYYGLFELLIQNRVIFKITLEKAICSDLTSIPHHIAEKILKMTQKLLFQDPLRNTTQS